MFESALHTLRPRRRASVILSTSIHAALMSALVFPPMLRMPELAQEPPDNMPRFVDIFTKPEIERPKTPELPRVPRTPSERANTGGGGPAPNVRIVVAPTTIGELPEPLAPGQKDDTAERLGSFPYEPEKTGTGLQPGDGDDRGVLP